MRSTRLDRNDLAAHVLVFDPGDEVMGGLLDFARAHRLRGGHFTGIGALSEVVLGYWDRERKDYRRIPIREQVEVLSLVGNVALAPGGGPQIHAHLVVGKADGTAHGGHLLEARVRPTLEIVLEEVPEALQRWLDPETGLALLAGGEDAG